MIPADAANTFTGIINLRAETFSQFTVRCTQALPPPEDPVTEDPVTEDPVVEVIDNTPTITQVFLIGGFNC